MVVAIKVIAALLLPLSRHSPIYGLLSIEKTRSAISTSSRCEPNQSHQYSIAARLAPRVSYETSQVSERGREQGRQRPPGQRPSQFRLHVHVNPHEHEQFQVIDHPLPTEAAAKFKVNNYSSSSTTTLLLSSRSSLLHSYLSLFLLTTNSNTLLSTTGEISAVQLEFESGSGVVHQQSPILGAATESGNNNDRNKNNKKVRYSWEDNLTSLKKESDEVVRVLDANTVKHKKNGVVSFAAVQTPSGYNDQNFRFPDCMTRSPSSKLRQLLPSGSKVFVVVVDKGTPTATGSSSGSRPRGALVINQERGVLVNAELVREGFARPIGRGRAQAEELLPGLTRDLYSMQQDAKEKGVGIYRQCDGEENSIASDDQFEPLDVVTEIQWGADGGKVVLKNNNNNNSNGGLLGPPPNPGDKRNCSDFRTYEDALKWYETFFPYYGDVARLDRDGDGIPCSGLPHTTDTTKYQVKKPSSVVRNEP